MVPRCQANAPTCLAVWIALVSASAGAGRADTLVYDTAEGQRLAEGTVAARTPAELLFLARDGRMHLVDQARVVAIRPAASDDEAKPFSRDEMVAELRSEFGAGFDVHRTANYLVCYSCDRAFAQSCGALFESLHRAFTNYFKAKKFQIEPSGYPLVAIVFGNEHDFLRYAQRELGDQMAQNVIGYYSFLSNRMVMYDMQAGGGRVGLGNVGPGRPPAGPRDINAFAAVNIATVIHEATHQLAYNSGFHRRFSDNPLWLAEGMAMFFEAPARQPGEWKGIGEVNRLRLQLFRDEFLTGHRPLQLESLVRDDERLGPKRTTLADYAECWALTYFLIKRHPQQFCAYLKILSEKPPLARDGPEQRLADFRAAFGPDMDKLHAEFVRYMATVR